MHFLISYAYQRHGQGKLLELSWFIKCRLESLDDRYAFQSLLTDCLLNLQHVRRAAVSALSTAAHNKPCLIKGLLPDLLPLLYDQTVVKVTLDFL